MGIVEIVPVVDFAEITMRELAYFIIYVADEISDLIKISVLFLSRLDTLHGKQYNVLAIKLEEVRIFPHCPAHSLLSTSRWASETANAANHPGTDQHTFEFALAARTLNHVKIIAIPPNLEVAEILRIFLLEV
ncbi:hypothetical protein OZX72_05530 [Bifidobacterium sp. ESL0769]|uniref:hypothetical protein n=1 Tax=Bifidobacterium sp. ESL0769 TaxID=2983229 RepID=UPI0023F65E43|nr:hypothetical protein [Bifidobacterium sp. ESL0769]WEV66733.1 hypothetical protein OZX72_05530 [Bifidobacterium sp. ESL0769]